MKKKITIKDSREKVTAYASVRNRKRRRRIRKENTRARQPASKEVQARVVPLENFTPARARV